MGSSSNVALEKNPISSKVKNVRKYGTNVEVLLDLEAGRTDAVVIDSIVGRYYVTKKENKENKDIFTVLNDSLAVEDMGIGMRKEDKSLIAEINNAIDGMKQDGTYNTIYEKWFGRRN
jgi:polar amino acid transport system substrate-binding protein